ncbi:MAG: HlyD family secretion protein [Bdellovibrio sp.]|nr:HlyD family secretion protein [Bdellovibrio sp.]
MDSKKKNIFLGIGAIAAMIAIYFVYEFFMYVETDNAYIEAHSVLISAKVPGYIKEIFINDGQKVKKGDILVQIDDRDYKAAFEAAQSEVLSLEARKKDTEKNFYRLRELLAKSVVSQQQYDAANAAYNEMKAKYDSAKSRATQAEISLEYTQLKAPSDGVIARSSAEIGQLANPGTALVGFVSSKQRWITANFKETELSDIKVGRKVDIKIDALNGKNFSGEVESISSATGSTFTLLPPDNATGNFTKVVQRVPVKIKINNLSEQDKDSMQAGLSAVVKVHLH